MSRFQRCSSPRAIPSFRLNSASVSSPRSTRPICSRLNSAVKIRRPSDFLAMRTISIARAYCLTATDWLVVKVSGVPLLSTTW
jgi:hypothetical protein